MPVKKKSKDAPARHLGEALREKRESLGISLRTLAARLDFSPSFISQVENGLASPSIGSLEKIAGALEMSLAELFRPSGSHTKSGIVRSSERPAIRSEWSQAEIESLLSRHDVQLEPMLVKLAPGGSSGKHPHASAREQFAYIVAGAVTLTLDGVDQVLKKGDAVSIPAAAAVRWQNHARSATQILIVSQAVKIFPSGKNSK
ncbi:helix-turn-helix domain-containing protein [Silvibacterium acidisoli]|uniref:helix-turn-helix domain-containing protein n=1 Tax=Acidobacteriaceae bacterium ZG23-2 TaxID=2883246 RepID=UPI00406D39A1